MQLQKDEKERSERNCGGKGSTRVFENVRGGLQTQRRGGYYHTLDKVTTSFFFTNIPDEVKTLELWKLFARFGRVSEVYIPKKVYKWGKRFDFVKFKEVVDAVELENKMGDGETIS